MTRILGVLIALALLLCSAPAAVAVPAAKKAPSREQWLMDVKKAMKGSDKYLRHRVQDADGKLAVNLDIDNSTLTTYYDGVDSVAIPRVKRFTDLAEDLGVRLVFNTGRIATAENRAVTLDQLRGAGFTVSRLCMRMPGEALAHSKQRCRDKFVAKGLTLVANVGNNTTDFLGDGYERAFKLPNYGQLG